LGLFIDLIDFFVSIQSCRSTVTKLGETDGIAHFSTASIYLRNGIDLCA
jgi:hypothetical protein